MIKFNLGAFPSLDCGLGRMIYGVQEGCRDCPYSLTVGLLKATGRGFKDHAT